MPLVIFGIPIALEYVGLTLLALTMSVKIYVESNDDYSMDDDTEFYDSVQSQETVKKEAIELEANTAVSDVETFVSISAPIIEETVSVSTVNPTTMPTYLAQQNELLQVQNEKTTNLINQSKFQNDLLAKSIQAQIVGNANSKMIAETLASSLPALVMQMQQVSKIPITLKTNSEIRTAYEELNLTHNESLLTAINELVYAFNTNALGTNAISANMAAVGENAVAQKVIADHQTTVAQITRMDGTVYAELTPLDLALQKDVATIEAKSKEKELADYQTTEQDIVNLDGNVVATMKPMEAATAKNITDAKNATDEMEFEIPDDIIEDVMGIIPLPSFMNYDYGLENNVLFNGGTI